MTFMVVAIAIYINNKLSNKLWSCLIIIQGEKTLRKPIYCHGTPYALLGNSSMHGDYQSIKISRLPVDIGVESVITSHSK